MFTSEIFRKKANEDAWSDGTGGMFGNGEGNPWTGGGGGGAGGMPNMAAEDQDQNAYIAPLTGVDESDGMSLQQLAPSVMRLWMLPITMVVVRPETVLAGKQT